MRRAVFGLFVYVEFGVCVLVFLPALGLVALLRPSDYGLRGSWMRRFGRTASRFNPLWKFSVEGAAPLDITQRPYVVVANHESTADPFLLSFLPWRMRWIAKDELFRIPVLGQMMKWGGDIRLRRGDGASVRAMLREAGKTLDGGLSVMIFPEGTRTGDGSLGAFKDGAFQLAVDAGVPVLPMAIVGTRACRPKGSRWFGKARASVRILPAIETDGMTGADLEALREQARTAIAGALVEMRRGPVEEPIVVSAPTPTRLPDAAQQLLSEAAKLLEDPPSVTAR